MKLSRSIIWKQTSYLVKALPLVPFLNDIIFETHSLSDVSVLFKIPVLSLFIITSFSILGRILEKDRDNDECFLERDWTLKVIILFLSFFYMIIFFSEGFSHFPILDIPSLTSEYRFFLFLFSALIFGSLIGYYIYRKNESIEVHHRFINNLFPHLSEEVTMSDYKTESQIYNKIGIYSNMIVGGTILSLIGGLFGFILFILLAYHLAIVVISLCWIGYDLNKRYGTGRFEIKSYVKYSIKKFSKKKKSLFEFKILSCGVAGIIKLITIIMGIMFTIFLPLELAIENIWIVEYRIETLINSGFTKDLILYTFNQIGYLLILPLLFGLIGLLFWLGLLKRTKYWLAPEKKNVEVFEEVKKLPSFGEIFIPFSLISWSILMGFPPWFSLSFPFVIFIITFSLIFLNLYYLSYYIKKIKTKDRMKREKLNYDNYRIIGLFFFTGIFWISIVPTIIGPIDRSFFVHRLHLLLPGLIVFGLSYFWREIMMVINSLNIDSELTKSFLKSTYFSVILLIGGIYIIESLYLLLLIIILVIFLYIQPYLSYKFSPRF